LAEVLESSILHLSENIISVLLCFTR